MIEENKTSPKIDFKDYRDAFSSHSPKYIREEENILNVYKQENQSLKKMIHHYETTLKCRENLINQYVNEIQNLKQTIKKQKQSIDSLNSQLQTYQNQKLFRDKLPTQKERSFNRISSAFPHKKILNEEFLHIPKQNVQTVTKSQGIGVNTNTFFQENERFADLFKNGLHRKMSSVKYKKIEDLLRCKGNSMITFNSLSPNEKEEIIELFILSYNEMKNFGRINYKLKGVITLYKNISKLNNFEEVIMTFNKEICFLFNCYKSLMYIQDEESKILWTSLETKGDYLKLPLDAKDNAVAYTALNDKIIRIDNTSEDFNFFRNVHNEKNLKIKNVLSYPIKNQEEKTFAVLELINKHDGRFTNEDEEFLALLSIQISNILQHFLEDEHMTQKYSHAQEFLKINLELSKCNNLEELIIKCQELIQEIENSMQVSIVINESNTNKFLKFHNKEKVEINKIDVGIVGKCFETNKMILSLSGKNDLNFNRLIDIESDLPILTFPVQYNKSILGVMQIVDFRKKIGENYIKKSFMHGDDFCEIFSKILGSHLIKFL